MPTEQAKIEEGATTEDFPALYKQTIEGQHYHELGNCSTGLGCMHSLRSKISDRNGRGSNNSIWLEMKRRGLLDSHDTSGGGDVFQKRC